MNKVEYSNGFYKADVLCNGLLKRGKTFFLQSWSREHVIVKIFESYDNPTQPVRCEFDQYYNWQPMTKKYV
jgi:hypothetical protein